jgi:hypothetical protein
VTSSVRRRRRVRVCRPTLFSAWAHHSVQQQQQQLLLHRHHPVSQRQSRAPAPAHPLHPCLLAPLATLALLCLVWVGEGLAGGLLGACRPPLQQPGSAPVQRRQLRLGVGRPLPLSPPPFLPSPPPCQQQRCHHHGQWRVWQWRRLRQRHPLHPRPLRRRRAAAPPHCPLRMALAPMSQCGSCRLLLPFCPPRQSSSQLLLAAAVAAATPSSPHPHPLSSQRAPPLPTLQPLQTCLGKVAGGWW